jgi:hypothetical protein
LPAATPFFDEMGSAGTKKTEAAKAEKKAKKEGTDPVTWDKMKGAIREQVLGGPTAHFPDGPPQLAPGKVYKLDLDKVISDRPTVHSHPLVLRGCTVDPATALFPHVNNT